MQDRSTIRRPSRAMWLAWGLAFAGGLAVMVAAVLALLHPCTREGACTADSLALAGYLAMGGTATAVTGGVGSAVLLVRRRT
ncbi:hypothetical protein [Egicoccus sp. AB-alg2]|uniref:hypothetical protein n=1 Tax=Egicoccus sp. AB-alg2 TaxID=3242693 RepID=UPI00359E96E0